MTTFRNASWWMVWVALSVLLAAEIIATREMMEKLTELDAKHQQFFNELRAQGLIGNGGG